jgi:hypothetical protein
MNIKQVISVIVGAVMLIAAAGTAFVWSFCRVYVYSDECLVLVRKSGEPMPAGQMIAEPGQKGIQREAMGPGRYFFIPWKWETERVALTDISAGDPATWRTVYLKGDPDYGIPRMEGEWPQVGIVTSLAGKPAPGATGNEVVDEGFQGIQRKVLTPGAYRINPRAFKVERAPAVVVPLGCCGVVTSQLGDMPAVEEITVTSVGPDGELVAGKPKSVQKLAEEGQRGILANVLPPGIYYLNPYVHKVKIVQIGYNQISQLRTDAAADIISFPSADGFTVEVDVTVVWGRHPAHMPEMINRLGDVERIKEIVLAHIRSICRNIGSEYVSTDFIQGEKREQYQNAVTETLQRIARERDIEILIALIRDIEVHGGTAIAQGEMDLKATIQAGFIAREQDLTKQALRETAKVKADLSASRAEIEVAREEIVSDTRKKVAEIAAEGNKKAEEIDAQRDLEVAQIERKIAELEAEMTLVLGKADADVARLKNQAEADGKRMMVTAFGTGSAYNLYTFAEQFQPDDIRLIFAGEGTFWTDLRGIQDAAGMELLRSAAQQGGADGDPDRPDAERRPNRRGANRP